jgi:hypothetical protein
MSKRIELNWGGGDFSVALNLKDGQLHAYKGSEQFHGEFGGKCYYTSRSGASGAGFINASPFVRSVSTYRTDSSFIEFPNEQYLGHTVGDITVVAPIDYRAHSIPGDYPVIVKDGNGNITFLDGYSLLSILTGKEQSDDYETKEVFVSFIRDQWGYENSKTVQVRVPARRSNFTGNTRRVVEAMFLNELSFQWPEERSEQSPFWNRLGLHTIGSRLYKISARICRKVYDRSDLDTVEKLQAAAPRNVIVLTPNCYLQESNGFQAAGIFNLDGNEVDYEVSVDTARAIRAMNGDFADIVTELEEGAQQKHRQHLEYQAQQALWAKTQEEQASIFTNLCEQHGEVEVTLQDSYAARNCEPGTLSFRDRTFPGKTAVKVSDLMPYADKVHGVRQAIMAAFNRLGLTSEVTNAAPVVVE